jgi:hypothetical protein
MGLPGDGGLWWSANGGPVYGRADATGLRDQAIGGGGFRGDDFIEVISSTPRLNDFHLTFYVTPGQYPSVTTYTCGPGGNAALTAFVLANWTATSCSIQITSVTPIDADSVRVVGTINGMLDGDGGTITGTMDIPFF